MVSDLDLGCSDSETLLNLENGEKTLEVEPTIDSDHTSILKLVLRLFSVLRACKFLIM